jgi:hypothetical protein
MTLIGQANPDCDYKPKLSVFGCRNQAKFRMFLKNDAGAYTDYEFYACDSHATEINDLLKEISQMIADRERVRVHVIVETMDQYRERCAAENEGRIIKA